MAKRSGSGSFAQFHKKPDELTTPSKRFAAAPDERLDWPLRRILEELLTDKVSLFHGQFQIEGVSVGLMMVAGMDAGRLMRIAGAAIAPELAQTESKKQQPTGHAPRRKSKCPTSIQ